MSYLSPLPIQEYADAMRRIYREYSRQLTALEKKHRDEITQCFGELEKRKMDDIRKTLLQL